MMAQKVFNDLSQNLQHSPNVLLRIILISNNVDNICNKVYHVQEIGYNYRGVYVRSDQSKERSVRCAEESS